MAEIAHHPTLSPSSLPAIDKCACYVSDPTPSEAAEKGTDEHELLANALRGNYEWDDNARPEVREKIEWAVEQIKMRADGPLVIEKRLTLLSENFETLTYGTLDAYSRCREIGRIALFDYKSGEIRDYNAQLVAYALMLMQTAGQTECHVFILFGRYKKVVEFVITREDAQQRIAALIARRRDPNRQPTPCDYCQWCANRLTCPPLNQAALAVNAGREDWKLETYHASEITSPAQMAKALRIARMLKGWIDAVEFHAKKMGNLPGFVLKDRNGKRFVKSLTDAFQRSGLTQEQFLECCDVSVTALEEEYAKANQMKLAPAKRELATKIGDAIGRGKSFKILEQE